MVVRRPRVWQDLPCPAQSDSFVPLLLEAEAVRASEPMRKTSALEQRSLAVTNQA